MGINDIFRFVGLKWVVWEIWAETFGSSYQEVQNIDGSGNQDSIVKFKLTMDLSPSV